MNTNIQKVFLLTTLLVVLVGLGALSAADVSDNTTATQSIAQDTPSTSTQVASTVSDTTDNNKVAEDTKVATTSKTKSVAKENTQANTKSKTVKKESEYTVTNSTFSNYFTDSKLNDDIANGSVLDFQGLFNSSEYKMTIERPVTITSTTHDAVIDLNTTGRSYFGNETGDSFTINNTHDVVVSYITFHNTQVFVKNSTNVTLDHINVTVENQNVGAGVGVTSIRDGSSYVTVTNSNFYTENNGGSSTLVLASANHTTIENNNITGVGNVGNLLYLTTYNVYNVEVIDVNTNSYNTIRNNKITGPTSSSGICYGIALTGHDNVIDNNTVIYPGAGITTQWISPTNDEDGNNSNSYTGNNYTNNNVTGTFSAPVNSTVINNTLGTSSISNNTTFSLNTVNGNLNVNGLNCYINSSTITGTITVSKSATNTTIHNTTYGKLVDKNNNAVINNINTITSNNINRLSSKSLKQEVNTVVVRPNDVSDDMYDFDYSNTNYILNGTFRNVLFGIGPRVANITITGINGTLIDSSINSNSVNNITIANLRFRISSSFENVNVVAFQHAINLVNPNAVIDNVTINAEWSQNDIINLIEVLNSQYVTVRNCNLKFDMLANTINWDEDSKPNALAVYTPRSKNVVLTDNNITINVVSYIGAYPTCWGLDINSDNTTISNNNISITADDLPGWLYAFEITSSNNLITNNNISVKGVNYTAGIYFDSSNYQNNTVSNNIINLTSGNSGYGEGTTNENVGYIITFTNRAYGGGSYLPGTGSVKNNTAVNNTLIGNGYAIYGIEQFGGDNTTIVNNTIILNGTAVSGVAMIGINSTVTGNNITVTGKDNGTYATVDYLTEQTTGISFQRGINNTATGNIIDSQNNAGIIISGDQNTNITNNTVRSLNNTYAITVINSASNINVSNNNLKAKDVKGDEAVLNDGTDNTVRDNGPNAVATTLVVDNITSVKVGNNITVTGKLVDETNTTVTGAVITVVSGNTTVNATTDANGSYVASIPTSNVGTFTVTLTYNGNDDYLASNATTNYTVNKLDTTVTIDPINGVLGKEVSFTAHVTDENNQTVTGGYIIFKVNGVTLKDANNTPIQVNVVNGTAVLTTTATWSKAVNTTAAYSGSDNYNKARTDNGSITIAKQNATVSVTINENIKPGENLIATVNVTDADGNIVNAGTVIFKINGKTLKDENNLTLVYNVTNGSVTLNYTIPDNYSAKTYTLTAVYGGSIYSRAETTQNFTLNKLDANVALNVTTDDLKPGSQIIAIATITDANGNPVTRGHVTFKLNNKTITDNDTRYVVDITNGVAILNYTIPSNYSAKTYKLSAVFSGSNYNTNEAAQNITLSKIDTNIVTQNITITDNTLNVQATINNVETGNVANERTQKVSIKYDKHTVINSTVIENGVIDLNTALTDVHAGEHIIEIVTSGNSIYNPNRVNATVVTQ